MFMMAPIGEDVSRAKRSVRAKRRNDLKFKRSKQTDVLKWASVLPGHPEMKKYCPWGKLTGRAWAMLLRKAPQLADKCDWKKLRRPDWVSLLCVQPRFSAKCPCRDEFSTIDWMRIYESQGDLVERLYWPRVG